MKTAVLHVIKTLELGGAETNLRNLMEAFDPEKFEHHVAYSFGGELEAFFRNKPSVKLYRFSGRKHRMGEPYSLVIILKLWRYILRHRIRIVHTHNFNAHFWAVYAAKLAGAKVVEHVHDFRYFEPRELERRKGDANLNRYIRVFRGLSDRVVVLTGQNLDFLVRNGFYPRGKVVIIPNGIPLPQAAPRPETDGRPVVLVASRMAPTKNIELVLDVAPRVLNEVPDAVFLIAGNGELLESFKKQAADKGLGAGVRFMGFRPDIVSRASFDLDPRSAEPGRARGRIVGRRLQQRRAHPRHRCVPARPFFRSGMGRDPHAPPQRPGAACPDRQRGAGALPPPFRYPADREEL